MNADTRTPQTAASASDGTGGHDDTLRASERRHGRDRTRDKTPPVRLLLTVEETAEALGVSRSTVYDLDTRARLPRPVRLTSRPQWRAGELRDWTEAGCPDRQTWEMMRQEKSGKES